MVRSSSIWLLADGDEGSVQSVGDVDMNSLADRTDRLFAEWDKPDSPGCALAVIQDGEIVYKKGYGMADLERNVPLSPRSVFDLASTSKQFVAMCILLLAEQGKLSLDDDIRRYIPEMPDYGEPITLRHLIHHTSGIRDYLELMSLCGMRFENDYHEGEIIALLARQRELNFGPGEEYLYSNSGYFLLGEIVKRVAGQMLNDFAREQIFQPLGMDHTRFYDDFKMIVPDRAIGYAPRDGVGYGIELYHFDFVGDGGLLTSVEDLSLWDQNFYENKLGGGGPELIDRMLSRGTLNDGKELSYAFGLELGGYRGLPIVSHSGGWAGYRSDIIRFPEQRFSVICLSNLSTSNPTALAKQVADLYLEDKYQEEPSRPGGEASLAPTPADLGSKTGDFINPKTGTVLNLSVEDGRLTVHHPSGLVFEITPTGGDRFRSVDAPVDLAFAFEEPPAGEAMRLQVRVEDEEPVAFQAIERISLEPHELEEYAGEYYSDELGVIYRFLLRDGTLVLKLGHDPAEPPLQPTVKDEFSVKDRNLQFVRDAQGRISGFNARSGRVVNVWFARKRPE
jgi:CubicO group peptidase (beta-lactamase class C family)